MTREEAIQQLVKSPVIFYDDSYTEPSMRHSYWLKGKRLKNTTSGSLIERAFPHKYEGIRTSTMQNAAERGTAVHHLVEHYEAEYAKYLCGDEPFEPTSNDINVQHWIEMKKNNNIEVLATEFLVSDNKHYASAIDILALVNGELAIIDIKHTFAVDYESVALQTSIYQMFLEYQCRKNNVKVAKRYVAWLREEQYEFTELPRISNKKIKELIRADILDKKEYTYDPGKRPEKKLHALENPKPRWWGKRLEKQLKKALYTQQEAHQNLENLKYELQQRMLKDDFKKIRSDVVNIAYVPPTQTTKFDMTALKKERPRLAQLLAERYSKTSTSKEYITIKFK